MPLYHEWTVCNSNGEPVRDQMVYRRIYKLEEVEVKDESLEYMLPLF